MALLPVPFAVNETIAEFAPPFTPLRLGADGTVAATNDAEAVDGGLSPRPLVATTVQVYVLPFVSELDGDRRARAGGRLRSCHRQLDVQVTV